MDALHSGRKKTFVVGVRGCKLLAEVLVDGMASSPRKDRR